jgi:xylan 1,4-beta-xylosidase
VLNVFRMYGMMGGRRVPAESSHAVSLETICREGVRTTPDVAALASVEARKLSVMVWHYHDDDLPGPLAEVALEVRGLAAGLSRALAHHYRIDGEHSNSYAAWQRMGSPQKPSSEQYRELERAAQLALLGSPEWVKPSNGAVTIRFPLPRQGVSLVQFTW